MSNWNYIERKKERLSKERKRLEDLLAKTEEKYENLKQSALGKIHIKITLIDSQFKVLGIFDELDKYDVEDNETVNEPGLFDNVNDAVRHDPGMTPKADPFIDTKKSFDDYWTDDKDVVPDGEDDAKEQDSSQQNNVHEYTEDDDSVEAEEETSEDVEDEEDDEDEEEDEEELDDYFRSLWQTDESEKKKKENAQDGNGEVRVFPIGVPVSSDEDEDEDRESGHESFVRDMKMIRGMFSTGKRN